MATTAAKPVSKEDVYAEQPTLEWLKELGWQYIHGFIIGPDGPAPERDRWDDVVLVGRLRAAVADLNPELPVEAVDQVVEIVRAPSSPNAIDDHADFHRLLLDGVPITYEDPDGIEQSTRARLVDFENPENNDLLAVNQFTVIEGTKNRRPDVLLFVNGLPLGQIELKNPADEKATNETAVHQVHHYVDTIPGLYRFVEFIGVSDLLRAHVGTITTPAEHFAEWKTMDPAESEGKPQLEVMLRGAFAPERFLDLIENFVLFEQTGKGTAKIMAKYHQVDAVSRAIDATRAAIAGDGRAGVVWHTQGAGKSYTMVFYVQRLRRMPEFANPTIVAVTDRTDLDNQLMETFAKQAELAQSIQQAQSIAGRTADGEPERDSLHELLKVPAGGIYFTTIQKFQPEGRGRGRAAGTNASQAEMPVLSERKNIIVMADEAHRSQYASFAQNLVKALPNATKIGFTGTPIERQDRSTRLAFGQYISVYSITRAVEDKATVPIYYETRAIPLAISKEELVEEVEALLEQEEEEAAGNLISRETRLDRVVGAEDRLDRVAEDIAQHYGVRRKTLEGKAMVVGMTREICVELTERLKKLLGDDAVTCVITAQAIEPKLNKYRRSKAEMAQVADDFKDPDHPLRVVIVRDMWLTGFDVPPLHTMYIDKPMRDHGLLQAIARVNRVFGDKPGGLVVDYIGIGEDLRAALPAYAPEDVEEAMVPLTDVVKKLREKHDIVAEFFHGLDYKSRGKMSPTELATLVAQAHAAVVRDEDETKRFLTEHALLARLYALASPDPAATELAEDVAFFSDIARMVRKYTPPEGEPSGAAQQAVKQVYSEGLGAGQVVDIFGLAGEERPEISVLSEEFLDRLLTEDKEPDLQIAVLKKLLNDEIRTRGGQNTMQAKLFSSELSEVLARYASRQVDSAEIVRALVELAHKMREARRRHEDLGLSVEEAAFYDAIAGHTGDWKADPDLARIARGLVKSVRNDLTVDWTSHASTEAAIRRKVKRILRHEHYTPPQRKGGGGGGRRMLDEVAGRVIEQARVLYRYWPDVSFDEWTV